MVWIWWGRSSSDPSNGAPVSVPFRSVRRPVRPGTSTLVGASSVAQLEENLGALSNLEFTPDELTEIDQYASDSGIDLWRESSDV